MSVVPIIIAGGLILITFLWFFMNWRESRKLKKLRRDYNENDDKGRNPKYLREGITGRVTEADSGFRNSESYSTGDGSFGKGRGVLPIQTLNVAPTDSNIIRQPEQQSRRLPSTRRTRRSWRR